MTVFLVNSKIIGVCRSLNTGGEKMHRETIFVVLFLE